MTKRTISPFGIGARVKVRAWSCLERSRWEKRDKVGEVVDFRAGIPGYGDGVIIRWFGEELSLAFTDTGQYEVVSPAEATR